MRSLLFCLALSPCILDAQTSDTTSRPRALVIGGVPVSTEEIQRQLEQSYITIKGGVAGNLPKLMFEGNIAPHFTLTPGDKFALVATPKVVLRMRDTASKPVRTPSYMPRLTLFIPTKIDIPEALYPRFRGFDRAYIVVQASHYSNGQEGPTFDDGGSLNLKDGNFSTNYVYLGYQVTNNNPTLVDPHAANFGVEWHPEAGMDEAFHDLLPPLRVHLGYYWNIDMNPRMNDKVSQALGRVASLGVAFNTPIGGKVPKASFKPASRLNMWASLTVRPKFLDELALFLNAYSGADYYNIHLMRRLNVVRFGFGTSNAIGTGPISTGTLLTPP